MLVSLRHRRVGAEERIHSFLQINVNLCNSPLLRKAVEDQSFTSHSNHRSIDFWVLKESGDRGMKKESDIERENQP